MFYPVMSTHLNGYHYDALRDALTTRHRKYLEAQDSWVSKLREAIQQRDKFSVGDAERQSAQQHLTRVKQRLEYEYLLIDEAYEKECIEVNDLAEQEFAMSHPQLASKANLVRKSPSNTHVQETSIESEGKQKYNALQAELQDQIKVLREKETSDKAKIEAERATMLGSSPSDSLLDDVNVEYDRRWDEVDLNINLQILSLKKRCAQLAAQYSAEASALKTQQLRHREDDARLVPIGKNDLYTRRYETLGDPSGNPIPIMAEPKQLQQGSANLNHN